MTEFSLGLDGIRKLRKQLIINFMMITLFVIGFGIALVLPDLNSIPSEIWLVPFFALIMVYSLYRGTTRQKKSLKSYKLIIDDETITRKIFNTPDIRLYFDEITEITKNSRGTITIKSDIRNSTIYAFSQVGNIDELESILSTIQPITIKKSTIFSKYFVFAGIIAFATALVGMYLATNKVVVSISSFIVLAIWGWSFYVIRTNKNIDAKTKRSSWFMIPISLAMAYMVYIKLIA